MKERLTALVERDELASRTAAAGADLGDRAGAADRRHTVAHGAAGAVERRTEPFAGALDFEKIVEAHTELLEFDRGHARQRIAGNSGARLGDDDDGGNHNKRSAEDQRQTLFEKRPSVPRRLHVS